MKEIQKKMNESQLPENVADFGLKIAKSSYQTGEKIGNKTNSLIDFIIDSIFK